jgi:nucleoid-associated protein YgaU
MGRLEKIVVLTVLFLVAVILGVSLNQGGDSVDPLPAGALAQGETQPDQPQTPGASGAAAQDGPVGVLNTALQQEGAGEPVLLDPAQAGKQEATPAPGAEAAAAIASKPDAAPVAGVLVTTEGLADSLDPDVMIYTWAEGDSFVALAERYFGSRLEVARLRRVNEGRAEADLRVGDRIFVPRRAPEAGELLAKSASAAGQWEGGVYRVENGDMLGKIAKKVYGSASKWRVIYEANRDVLASPDSLEVGMALRIPRLE